MKLIDKDALVAEIERRKEISKYRDTNDSLFEDEAILSFINTIEVKEVDLEKEISEYFVSHPDEFFSDKYKLIAKHFFELGMQQSKKNDSKH